MDHSENRYEIQAAAVRRITWIGLAANLSIAVIKILAGWLGSSKAVVADGFHSLSDLTTDIVMLFGVSYWAAPADDDHQYGHSRIETMVTLFIAASIMTAGVAIGWSAVNNLREGDFGTPGFPALIGALISIIVKEIVYRRTMAAAKEVKSKALEANAWHHRSDSISSIPALLAVGVAMINPALAFVDSIGALIVSLFIIKVAFDLMKPAFLELTDTGASEAEIEEIRNIALRVDGVCDVHAIRSRSFGSGYLVDLHVLVEDDLTVLEGHRIGKKVKLKLLDEGPPILDVVVHLEPWRDSEKRGC